MNERVLNAKKKHTKSKQIRQISGLARRGQSQRVYYQSDTVHGYRRARFVTSGRESPDLYIASTGEVVPMRPSSALFSLFKVWLGEEERLSTMVDSSEFLVSEASTNLSACVFVMGKNRDHART